VVALLLNLNDRSHRYIATQLLGHVVHEPFSPFGGPAVGALLAAKGGMRSRQVWSGEANESEPPPKSSVRTYPWLSYREKPGHPRSSNGS
jgi:hypothetical protein